MIIFVSKTSDTLNGKPLLIENLSDYICLSPNYRSITLTNDTVKILLDSGAFQDRKKDTRLTFDNALIRQLKFETELNKISDYIVAYDLIDCYETTLEANKFIVNENLDCRKKVIMTQGITNEDYLFCLNENLDMLDNNCILGLGGISKAATNNKLQAKIFNSINILNDSDIIHLHLFGIGSIKLLRKIKQSLNTDIILSCDSATFEIQSVMGKILESNGKWVKKYTKSDKYVNYHPCNLSIKNITTAVNIIKDI